jgi:hypothetical protein
MDKRTIAAALAAAALLTLTACEGSNTSPSKPDSTTQDTNDQPKTDTSTEAPDEATDAEPETATLPNLVGQDLQAAQDAAQEAGFYALDDQDASSEGRLQVYDRNWIVCSQDPEPGTHPTDTPVTLYAVKDTESC